MDVGVSFFGDEIGLLGKGAVGLPGDSEVEESAVELSEVVEVEKGAVGTLVDVEVEEGAIELPEFPEVAEVEKGAVGFPGDAQVEDEVAAGFPGDAEVEEGAIGLPGDAEAEVALTVQSEASAVEIVVPVEVVQVLELAFGSSGCSLDLDSAFSREGSYSMLGQEREPLLKICLETDGAADCWMAGDRNWAATFERLKHGGKARLLRADFGCA